MTKRIGRGVVGRRVRIGGSGEVWTVKSLGHDNTANLQSILSKRMHLYGVKREDLVFVRGRYMVRV